MRKFLPLTFLLALLSSLAFSQTDKVWSVYSETSGKLTTDKGVARQSFPKVFKLYQLNIEPLRQQLFSIVGNQSRNLSTVISLPNADGEMELFEVFEASNFEPALQARYPEIRAYSGKGITDRYAMLKLSISPQGIQTMVFRADGKPSEYIEPYSEDHTVYATFKAQRNKGGSPWVCSTPDADMASNLNTAVSSRPMSNTGELKTMRLAQSCNGEYANYFGAFSSAQEALVLAAYNATLTRCNGCYEKDLAIHLNLVPETVNVIYYNPATDPYTTLANWNTQLQIALNTTLTGPGTSLAANNAAYDIGHMFGASGGGGNAGCIGCVCVDGVASGTGSTKGRGITSPADGIPQGDNFDIDYVAHEVGHQMGGNHTFSMSLEGTGVNKEVGSGITIMGYAGITAQDVAPHSIDIFHQATIQQIQANMVGKTCPITTNITANNATPVVAPVSNYTIPISTPFALTGSATDANPGDALTYCWEQNDNSTTTGNASVASPTKLTGPNWLSFSPLTIPTRTCPILPTILAGNFITGPLPGGDAIANIEALSSVSRTLNFRLTVRDNAPYSSTAPVKVGQTAFTDMVVTVTNSSGPFKVTVPNSSAINWANGSTQTITWDVANTTGSPVSCANVRILLSVDGGLTFPIELAANTPNDGSENVLINGGPTTTARVKVESIGNIFFDISDANFTISGPAAPTFNFNSIAATNVACAAVTTASSTLATSVVSGFNTPISLAATSGVPAGTSVTFDVNPLTPGNSVIVTLNNVNTLAPGTYNITITGTAGAEVKTQVVPFVVLPGAGPSITAQPAVQSVCVGTGATFSTTATGVQTYQWQVSTGGPFTNITGATSATYNIPSTTGSQNGNIYHVVLTGQCGTTISSDAVLTVTTAPSITTSPAATSACTGGNATFTANATGTSLGYQWQVSTGGPFTNIAGATSSTLTLTNVTAGMNGNQYQVLISNTCATATSIPAILTVNNTAAINTQPQPQTVCSGVSVSFSVNAVGTGLGYQWQVSTDGGLTWNNIPGATASTLTIPTAAQSMDGTRYRVQISSTCSPGVPTTSNAVTLNVFTPVTIDTPPPAELKGCVGEDVTFEVEATGTGLQYQWHVSINNGTTYTDIPGATSSTYTINNVSLSSNGYLYTVTVSGIPCGVITTDATRLIVSSKPGVVLAPGRPNTAITPSTPIRVYATVSPAGVNYVYNWTLNNQAISETGSSVLVTPDGFGSYEVTVTDPGTGCTAKSNLVEISDAFSNQVFVYPNPNTGRFQVRYYGPVTGSTVRSIVMYDAKGARVLNKSYTLAQTYGAMYVDMRNMNTGIYMLELRDAAGVRLGSTTVIVK